MRAHTSSATPFDEGKKAAKIRADGTNPYTDGSVEHRNFELGRSFGLRHFKLRDGQRSFELRA